MKYHYIYIIDINKIQNGWWKILEKRKNNKEYCPFCFETNNKSATDYKLEKHYCDYG